MKKKCQQDGFSLIELLLVVTIIGIITAIGIPSMQKAKTVAQNGATLSILRTLATAEADFYTHNNRYARLSELNSANDNRFGTLGTNQLFRGGFTYQLSPIVNPTDTDIKQQYTIIATRPGTGSQPDFVATVDQSGTITQVTP